MGNMAQSTRNTIPNTVSSKRVPNKTIVFSQWTCMLDIVETALIRDEIQFVRLDGSMTVASRDSAITKFSESSDFNVFLVSLKAVALGLNLVAANHVVLLDPWWNPALEEQAIDRAHRIGQMREVTIHRFTVTGTVEDKIIQLQEQKMSFVRKA